MKRRALILLVPAALSAQLPDPDPADPWRDLAAVWNPFAEKMKVGIVDTRQWKKVVAMIDRIEGRGACKAK